VDHHRYKGFRSRVSALMAGFGPQRLGAGWPAPETTYSQLIRFLLPLVLTMVALEFSAQVLNGGMARMPRAIETLASYGLAWGLVMFLTTILSQVRQLGLVLVDSQRTYWTVQRFVLLAGLLMAAILATLALSPLGEWVIYDLHGVDQSLGLVARQGLFWLIPVPLLRALAWLYAGLLMRERRTDLASYAVLAGIGASIVSVFVLLPAAFVQEDPIWLPILVTYAGLLAELGVVLWGYRRYRDRLPQGTDGGLSYSYVFQFFWPLALIMGIQGFSRPLINLFISREPGGAAALAVLTVVYSLAHLAYGWVNELRSLASAFRDQKDSLFYIRPFSLACGLFSFGLMVVLFWTPIRTVILETLLGLDPYLAELAAAPLMIFCFFPLVVMIRAYLHGIGLLEHRTKAMAPSAPARIVTILLALIVLPLLGVHGATRGVAALLCGFTVEALVVWWGVRGRSRQTILGKAT
jgi:hypothetical protein